MRQRTRKCPCRYHEYGQGQSPNRLNKSGIEIYPIYVCFMGIEKGSCELVRITFHFDYAKGYQVAIAEVKKGGAE